MKRLAQFLRFGYAKNEAFFEKASLSLFVFIVIGGIISAAAVNIDGVGPLRPLIYSLSFLGSMGFFSSHIRIIRGSADGKAYLGVVVQTYVYLALSVTFLSLIIIVVLRALGVAVVGPDIETRILYGLIGSSSFAIFAGGLVFGAGERYGYLFHRVDAWPLTILRRAVGSAEDAKYRDVLLVKMLSTVPGATGGAAIMSALFEEGLVWWLYGVWIIITLAIWTLPSLAPWSPMKRQGLRIGWLDFISKHIFRASDRYLDRFESFGRANSPGARKS